MNSSEFITEAQKGLAKVLRPDTITEPERIALRARYGFILSSIYNMGDADLDFPPEQLLRRAEVTDGVIQRIEEGIAKLEARMWQASPYIPHHILSPINRIKSNANNPLRNKYRLKIAVREGKISQFPIPPNSFFYALCGDTRKDVAASFRAYDRTMFMPEVFDSENQYDQLIASHESMHVTIDDAQRSKIQSVKDAGQYLEGHEFFSESSGNPKRMLLNEELSPYARELQIANFALGDALASGAGISVDEAIIRLKARPEQRPGVSLLLYLAKAFFPEGASHTPEQPYPGRFAKAIVDCHKHFGYEIWKTDPNTQNGYSRIL